MFWCFDVPLDHGQPQFPCGGTSPARRPCLGARRNGFVVGAIPKIPWIAFCQRVANWNIVLPTGGNLEVRSANGWQMHFDVDCDFDFDARRYANDLDPMHDLLADFQHAHRIPVLSIRARFGDRELAFGLDQRMPIASVTKSFTARAIECTGTNLDTRVSDLLPWFRLHDERATRRMTLRDLLAHRSGLPPHTWAWVFAPGSRVDFLREQLPHLESTGPHDEHARYSNLAYAIAGACLQPLVDRAWEAHLTETLFPGLPDTNHLGAEWFTGAQIAPPHRNGRGCPPFHARLGHPIAPASELISSTPDLLRWLERWLETPDSACLQPQSRKNETWQYGLGWRLESIDGVCHAWHTGGCSGYSACISHLPGRDAAIAILANDHGQMKRLHHLCHQLYGAAGLLPPVEPLPPRPLPTPDATDLEAEPPEIQPADLTGRFAHPGYGTLDIKDGRITWNEEPGGIVEQLGEAWIWRLPQYRCTFDVSVSSDRVLADLESALPPIRFERGTS